MAKSTLSEVNEGIQRRVRNKFRRSLQILQVSADEQGLVGNNMPHPDDKTSLVEKQSKAVEKVTVAEKENVAVRRSKRKTAIVKVAYVESPIEPKTTKSSAKNITKAKKTASKSVKGRSTTGKKNEQNAALNQTKLDFAPVAANTVLKENTDVSQSNNSEKIISSTEVTEDSGFDPSCGVTDLSPMNSTAVLKSPDIKSYEHEMSMITGDNPPLSYWRDLAEQRRIALEKVLHENELLHDQLTVLEAENSQLKQLVREAENLAQVVRAIVD